VSVASLNLADWVILAIIALSVLTAAMQGFLFEVISLAGVVLGYLLAVWEYHFVANWFAPYVKAPWVADILGFIVILLAVMVLAGIIARLARWLMKEVGLHWFDRILGGAFGLVRGCLTAAIVLLGFTTFNPQSNWLEGSRLAPYFLVVAHGASWLAPYDVRARFRQGAEAVTKFQAGAVHADKHASP
jgi:membrane protein required for colicin V production